MHARTCAEFAIVATLCAVAFFVVIPAQVSSQGAIGLQADMVPRAAVAAIAFLSVVQLIIRLAAPVPGDASSPSLGYPLMLLVAIGAGVAVIAFAGFYAGGVVLVSLITVVMGERRPLRVALHALGAVLVIALAQFIGL